MMFAGLPQAGLAIVARFFINMCYTSAIQWGTEVLPTPFRASGSSALHMFGYVATVFSPFIVYLVSCWTLIYRIQNCAYSVYFSIASYRSLTITYVEKQGDHIPPTKLVAPKTRQGISRGLLVQLLMTEL